MDKNGDHQIARFSAPICPLSLGLNTDQDDAMTQRIVTIATSAGVRAGAKGCDPNLVVIVADTGHQFLQKLHSAHPAIFGAMGWREISALLQEDGPVHTWQIKERSSPDGVPIGFSADGSSSEEPINPGSSALSGQANYLWSPSLIEKGVQQTLDASFVVIDAKAVDSLTIAQIADYAAMRTLAVTRAPTRSSSESDTILTLFDPPSSAQKLNGLSPTDVAYLHALYATSNAVSGTMQRANILNLIKRTLATAPH
jgi:hypothetical protein